MWSDCLLHTVTFEHGLLFCLLEIYSHGSNIEQFFIETPNVHSSCYFERQQCAPTASENLCVMNIGNSYIFLRYIPAYNIEHFNLDENYLFMYNSLNQMSITYCASSILVCIMIFLNIFSCILALTAFLWDTNYT